MDNPAFFVETKSVHSGIDSDPIGVRTIFGDFVMRCKFPLSKIYQDISEGNKAPHQVHYNFFQKQTLPNIEYNEQEKFALDLVQIGDGNNDRQNYEDVIALENLQANVKKRSCNWKIHSRFVMEEQRRRNRHEH